MRKTIIAGNWKMFTTKSEAESLAKGLAAEVGSVTEVEIVLCPPAINIETVISAVAGTSLKVGAQNLYLGKEGAFTGETSAPMIVSHNCNYVIIGHSERRQYFGETDSSVNQKVKTAFDYGLIPIVCVGETLEERESDRTFELIATQLKAGLADLSSEVLTQNKPIVIAYEPVWAIGTGKVASPAQAQDVHAFIRSQLASIFSEAKAASIQIQYGGSVKPENSKELMGQPDIDGALVGGASLKADSFSAIIKACI